MPFGLSRFPLLDHGFLLARHGYLFTAHLKEDERRALYETGALDIRLLGRPSLVVTGATGVDLFYDERRLQRHKAVPPPVALSLFGPGAVHALDDEAHRHRKELFRRALSESELARLLRIAEGHWHDEFERWALAAGGEMYSSAIDVFGVSIMEWAGIDEPDESRRRHARWLAQIVDGFGVPGPAYVRAAAARHRCDRWAEGLISDERRSALAARDSWLARVATFVDHDGEQLPVRTAAVELLNILRPTVAVSWLASFAAVALAEQPEWRARIREEDAGPGEGRSAQAFAHEVRRYYPFVPVLAARARHDFDSAGRSVTKGQQVLLDVYGTNHGPGWEKPVGLRPRTLPRLRSMHDHPVRPARRGPGRHRAPVSRRGGLQRPSRTDRPAAGRTTAPRAGASGPGLLDATHAHPARRRNSPDMGLLLRGHPEVHRMMRKKHVIRPSALRQQQPRGPGGATHCPTRFSNVAEGRR